MRSIARLAFALIYVTVGFQVSAHHSSELSSTPCSSLAPISSPTKDWSSYSAPTVPACTFCRPVAKHTTTVSGALTTHTTTECTTISSCTETINPWGTPTSSETATASETASCWYNGVPWPCTKETPGPSSMSTVDTTIYKTVPCSSTGATITASYVTSGVPYPTTNGTSVLASATATPKFVNGAGGIAENLVMKVKVGLLALVAAVLGASIA